MDLEAVARELLRVPPGAFVAERTARQRNIRSHDRALAAAIAGLRKPTPAAWIVDLLAADGALDDVVALGPTLRGAQERADPDEIRTLRARRSRLVADLVREGIERAASAGHRATDTVVEQVRATVEAAMSDPRAGEAVRSGLLVRALEGAGFEPVDLDGSVAVPGALPFDTDSDTDAPVADPIPITSGSRTSGRRARGTAADVAEPTRASRPPADGSRRQARAARAEADEQAAERVRQRARDDESAARTASRGADAAFDAAETALVAAEAEREALRDRRRALDDAVRELSAAEDRADAGLARALTDRDRAERASDDARAALDAVRRRRRGI